MRATSDKGKYMDRNGQMADDREGRRRRRRGKGGEIPP